MSRTTVIGITIVAAILGMVLLVAVIGTAAGPATGREQIAVLHLDGPIQDGAVGGLGLTGAITPDVVRSRLGQIEANPRIRAVILRLNSPGGTVAASEEIVALLEGLDVPVVVSMGDQAMSGGYYISTAADRIVAQPGTMTGSIGVIWSIIDLDELLDTLGVEFDAIVAGEHKDMFLPGRLTPERRELVQEQVDLLYDDFVRLVADARGLAEDDVRALATGEIYTGRQALELGLIDELGGLTEAVAIAEELAGIEAAQLVDLRPTFFEALFGGPGFDPRGLLQDGFAPPELILLRDALTNVNTPRYGP